MKEIEQLAILVGVDVNHNPRFHYEMEELSNLAAACDIKVLGSVVQNLHAIHSRHFVGQGKLDEIRDAFTQKEANLIIFNAELTPSQLRRIEKELECKIIDRTMLILEIFNARANTKESQIQVDIAQLRYFLPRLTGLHASLGRQSGGVGTKNKGLGEKKIELDKRRIENQIVMLKHELKEIIAQRQVQRKWRKKEGIKTVAIVGYTNAGKSTLMNTIIGKFTDEPKNVFTKDMLFATLQTAARRVDMPQKKSFLLTDTVGFVSNLPHHLVDAFKSTLEEIREADLLLHVVDVSDESASEMMHVTEQTLEQLGSKDIPTLYVMNKADLIGDTVIVDDDKNHYISAKTGAGVDALLESVKTHIFSDFKYYSVLIPYNKGQITAHFHQNVQVDSETFEATGVRLEIFASEKLAFKYRDDLLEITEL
ncbi:MAG: GTPase HflX [Culicoidibacterales bacterium]